MLNESKVLFRNCGKKVFVEKYPEMYIQLIIPVCYFLKYHITLACAKEKMIKVKKAIIMWNLYN